MQPSFFLSPDCPQTSRDVEELTRFLDESVEAGTEGLIVKTVAGEQCRLRRRERRGAWSNCATPGVGRRGRAASACLLRRWLADRRSSYPQLAASALPAQTRARLPKRQYALHPFRCIAVVPADLVVVCLPCPALPCPDSYEPSKRSSHWLKLKKDYLEVGLVVSFGCSSRIPASKLLASWLVKL